MSLSIETPVKPRKQRWLLIGFIVAVLITVFFGVRAVRRFINRPSNEPIREWMNIPYVAHSYHVPPPTLFKSLNLADKPPPDRRPIKAIAKELGKTSDEVIAILQEAIVNARPPRPPPSNQAEPTPTAA